MRYVPWDELNGRPNIIVDGYPADGTLITLSHWKGSGSPEELADDLSTQIAFRYLDRPDLKVDAELVSNNHFDEDGLSGIYAILHPDEALARREKIIQVASAGDFGVFTDRDAARVAFALMTMADEDRSNLGGDVFAKPYPQQSALFYEEGLARFPEMLEHPDRFKGLWQLDDAWFERDDDRARSGAIAIEERPEIDLAIVRLPHDTEAAFPSEFSLLGCHQSAIHNRTRLNRVALIRGDEYAVRYRYETWVQFVSAPVMARVDLAPLAEELTSRETGGSKWEFDGNSDLTPWLKASGSSALSPEDFVGAVDGFLRRAAA
ncbi:MAG: DUF6687 family protein [Actinomycetota bacterium]